MGDFELATETFPIWKAAAWCFYPILILFIIDILSGGVDDDDDQGGGMMIPAYQSSRSN